MGWMVPVRPTALIGIVALGLALGSIVLGHVILVPALQGDTSLVDANLARSLSAPLALRSAELALAACVLLAAVAQRWLRHRAGTTLALLAVGLAGVDRLGVLPRVHEAWGRVDLVAMRPQIRVVAAEQLSLVHEATLLALTITLVALAGLASMKRAA